MVQTVLVLSEGLVQGPLGSCFISPYPAAPGRATKAAPTLRSLLQISASRSRRKPGQWVEGPGKLVGAKIPLPPALGAQREKARPALAFLFPSPPPRRGARGAAGRRSRASRFVLAARPGLPIAGYW